MTRPTRILDLAEVPEADRDLYFPTTAGDGFWLHPDLAAYVDEAAAKLAELEATTARKNAQLRDLIAKGEVEKLLAAAGVERALLGGAVALFCQRNQLDVDVDSEVVTGAGGAALEAMVEAFLADDRQRAYRPGARKKQAVVAGYAAALRDLGRGVAH